MLHQNSPKKLKTDSDMSTPFDFDKLDYLNFDLIICIYVTAVYQRHLSGNISYTYLNKCTKFITLYYKYYGGLVNTIQSNIFII